MFSEEELICIAVHLDEEKRKSRKRKSVHESLLQRKEEWKCFTLYKELVKDSARFNQYFRMSESMHLNFLSLIEDLIRKILPFAKPSQPGKIINLLEVKRTLSLYLLLGYMFENNLLQPCNHQS
jgi:hypothetical protein